MSDLIERLREEARDAHEVIGSHESVMSARHIHRLGDRLLEAAAELARLRSTVTSEEVQQAAMFARKHVKSRTAGDGAYGEGEDCVALDLLDQLADLIESLARSEADAKAANEDFRIACADFTRRIDEYERQLAAHKADAERYRWLQQNHGPNSIFRVAQWNMFHGTHFFIESDGLDAAIDAALGK